MDTRTEGTSTKHKGQETTRGTTQPHTLVQIHMASVPGSPGQLAKVLTLNTFVQWGDIEVRQGKELIQWKSVDDEERWVDLAIAMHEGAVPAKLMALYTIPKEGLTDIARAAMALRDEQVCVQSYHAALEAITE